MSAPVALVTGASGFVGSHVVEALISRGYRVRCLLRAQSPMEWLEGRPIEVFRGDCLAPESLGPAVNGVELLIHVAGLVKARDPLDFYQINEEGTVNLLRTCRETAGSLRRFVLVSSLAALGPSPDGQPLSEEATPHPVSDYGRSKLRAEAAVQAASQHLPTAIVRPSTVYGPRDRATFPYFAMAARGFIVAVRKGGRVSLVHAADLAKGLVAAGEHPGPSGEIYHLADPRSYTDEEVVAATRAAFGKGRRVQIPVTLLRLLGAAADAAARLTGRAFFLSRQKVEEIQYRYWVCDVSKAMRQLGLQITRTLTDGFRDTIGWYRQHGWL